VSCALRCESSGLCLSCEFCRSASATGHHDLLREDELVVFRALPPRLDADEPEADFFVVVRGRLDVESLRVDFFAVGRGRLDEVALAAGCFAAPLDAVLLDGLESPSDLVPRGDFCSDS
jgi:hypothetical protein